MSRSLICDDMAYRFHNDETPNSEARDISRKAKEIVRSKLRRQALPKLSIHGNTCNTCARTNVPRRQMEVVHVGPKLSETMADDTLRLLQEHDNSGNLALKRTFSEGSLFRKMLVGTVADNILQKHKDGRIRTVIACNNCNKGYESVNPQEFVKLQTPTIKKVTGQTTLNFPTQLPTFNLDKDSSDSNSDTGESLSGEDESLDINGQFEAAASIIGRRENKQENEKQEESSDEDKSLKRPRGSVDTDSCESRPSTSQSKRQRRFTRPDYSDNGAHLANATKETERIFKDYMEHYMCKEESGRPHVNDIRKKQAYECYKTVCVSIGVKPVGSGKDFPRMLADYGHSVQTVGYGGNQQRVTGLRFNPDTVETKVGGTDCNGKEWLQFVSLKNPQTRLR